MKTKSIIIVIVAIALVGVVGIANAKQTLPKGGDSFDTAVKLEPGSYQGGSLKSKEVEYFYITGIKLGQEINIKGTFLAVSINAGAEAILVLCDKDGAELVGEVDVTYEKPVSMMISFPHRGKESDKYYIKAGSGLFKIASYSLEISLEGEGDVSPDAGEGVPPPTDGGEEAPKKGPNWALILGIIAAVIVIGVVAYFLLKKKKK